MRCRAWRAGTAAVLLALASACSGDGGSDEALCALVDDTSAFTGRFGEGLDPTDTERALDQLTTARGDLTRLRAAAPSSVDGALDDELAYVDALIEVLETVDPAEPAQVVQAVNALEDERAAADVAALELAAWAEEAC